MSNQNPPSMSSPCERTSLGVNSVRIVGTANAMRRLTQDGIWRAGDFMSASFRKELTVRDPAESNRETGTLKDKGFHLVCRGMNQRRRIKVPIRMARLFLRPAAHFGSRSKGCSELHSQKRTAGHRVQSLPPLSLHYAWSGREGVQAHG